MSIGIRVDFIIVVTVRVPSLFTFFFSSRNQAIYLFFAHAGFFPVQWCLLDGFHLPLGTGLWGGTRTVGCRYECTRTDQVRCEYKLLAMDKTGRFSQVKEPLGESMSCLVKVQWAVPYTRGGEGLLGRARGWTGLGEVIAIASIKDSPILGLQILFVDMMYPD